MYAVLRLNSFDPTTLPVSEERLAEFDRVHAGQSGYVGGVVVDLGEGRRFVLDTDQRFFAAWACLTVAEKDELAGLFGRLRDGAGMP